MHIYVYIYMYAYNAQARSGNVSAFGHLHDAFPCLSTHELLLDWTWDTKIVLSNCYSVMGS